MKLGMLYTTKFCSRSTYPRNWFSLFMGQRTNILVSQKCCRKFDREKYYPSMAKNVKKWVEGCEEGVRDKRFPNATITPELLNLPEWDLGPKDAMQINFLPNVPPSGGYENVLTADQCSRSAH